MNVGVVSIKNDFIKAIIHVLKVVRMFVDVWDIQLAPSNFNNHDRYQACWEREQVPRNNAVKKIESGHFEALKLRSQDHFVVLKCGSQDTILTPPLLRTKFVFGGGGMTMFLRGSGCQHLIPFNPATALASQCQQQIVLPKGLYSQIPPYC